MLGSLGPMEIGIILLVALLLFGPRRLPALGRSIGETIREMRSAGRALVELDPAPIKRGAPISSPTQERDDETR